MFEVGFSELVLILVIALLVLGPDKLPKLARDVGRWMGRARQMARQLTEQLDQESRMAEWTLEDKRREHTLRNAPLIPDIADASLPRPYPAAIDAAADASLPRPYPAAIDATAPVAATTSTPGAEPAAVNVPLEPATATNDHDRPNV